MNWQSQINQENVLAGIVVSKNSYGQVAIIDSAK